MTPVRLQFSVELDYEVYAPGADFIFNLQAAATRQQRVLHERLSLSQPLRPEVFVDAQTQARHLRLRLACTIDNRSAQQLVVEALDRFLEAKPGLEDLARRALRS